jgi:hypothetical protein
MGGVGQRDRVRASAKCGDEWMATGACTAPPSPETMTRVRSPRGATTTETPSPTGSSQCGHRFQRTNALLVGGEEDSPCSEIDCLRARAGSLLSIVPEIATDPQIKPGKK